EVTGARIRRNGKFVSVKIVVRPLRSAKVGDGLLLVIFHELPEPSPAVESTEPREDALGGRLKFELRSIRQEFEGTLEQLESSNEQLKASNEEIMSMNEELQSANEELETSKEELQSLNEELNTVNIQLNEKVAELEATNNDLANLFASAEVATLFLDRECRIKRFTPATTKLLSLIKTDLGRPISDIAHKYQDDD